MTLLDRIFHPLGIFTLSILAPKLSVNMESKGCFFRLPGPGNIVGHCLLEYGDFSCYKLQKMSLDILYKKMAPVLNDGDFTGYLLMKMS